MDREEIERRDLPAARRGYETAAVDTHLRRVSDAFDALGPTGADRRQAGSLAAGASSQVRAILEAAEASADLLREESGREASGHVERVADAARGMVEKLDHLQGELDRLLAGLKSTTEVLAGSLAELSREVGTLREPVEPTGGVEPATNGARSDDDAGARLVALNMALEGASRDDARRFLAEHYALADVDTLLEDVYSSAGR